MVGRFRSRSIFFALHSFFRVKLSWTKILKMVDAIKQVTTQKQKLKDNWIQHGNPHL